ncbi:MAG TPA: M23 family metallopeptidase, partial [Anaerolineaceae bacterium]|nr:M23 family metallopeptidase [Anaerolineaceae bacterium]
MMKNYFWISILLLATLAWPPPRVQPAGRITYPDDLPAGRINPPDDVPAERLLIAYSQTDQEILELMPDVARPDLYPAAAQPPPQLVFVNDAAAGRVPQGFDDLFNVAALPDTFLLYSADCYGDQLRQAADGLGLTLSDEQLAVLADVAALKAVNSRLLLAVARIKAAPTRQAELQQWTNWLYLEAGRIRSALGPFTGTDETVVAFADDRVLAFQAAPPNPGYWALVMMFAGGRSLAQTRAQIDALLAVYQDQFGSPLQDEAQPAAENPILHRPYTAGLTGRGYYDHRYPSVDNGGYPNDSGIVDYLGRNNTNYDTHDADDFWIPYGSSVLAPAAGQVIWVSDPAQGCFIMRLHSTTYDIVMCHLSVTSVSLWQNLTTGQVVGYSGVANGVNHLHFEVRHNGKQVDSMGWYGGGPDPCPLGPGPTGSYRGCEESVWLWADSCAPDRTPPVTTPTLSGTLGNNGWYRSAVSISLAAADDGCGAGIQKIQYRSDGSAWITYSAPFTILDGWHQVDYQALDNSGNWEAVKSIQLKVDTVAPAGSLNLNQGAVLTHVTLVRAGLAGSDATSGLSGYRIREAGGSWSSWRLSTDSVLWLLAPVPGSAQQVEVQYQDLAGNLSPVIADTIQLELNPGPPASSQYVLRRGTFGSAGFGGQSAGYRSWGTLGQSSLAGIATSANYKLCAGYWAQGCLPPTPS